MAMAIAFQNEISQVNFRSDCGRREAIAMVASNIHLQNTKINEIAAAFKLIAC